MNFFPEPYAYNKTDPDDYAAFEELALLSENSEVMEAIEQSNTDNDKVRF